MQELCKKLEEVGIETKNRLRGLEIKELLKEQSDIFGLQYSIRIVCDFTPNGIINDLYIYLNKIDYFLFETSFRLNHIGDYNCSVKFNSEFYNWLPETMEGILDKYIDELDSFTNKLLEEKTHYFIRNKTIDDLLA